MPIYVSQPSASPERVSDPLPPLPFAVHENELHQRRDYYKLVMADTCQVCDDLSLAMIRDRFRSADDGCVGRRSSRVEEALKVDSAGQDRLSVSMSGAHMRYLLPRDFDGSENDEPADAGSSEVDGHTEQDAHGPASTGEEIMEDEKDEVDSRERSVSYYNPTSNVRGERRFVARVSLGLNLTPCFRQTSPQVRTTVT